MASGKQQTRRPVARTKENRPPVQVTSESEGKMSILRFSEMIPPSITCTCNLSFSLLSVSERAQILSCSISQGLVIKALTWRSVQSIWIACAALCVLCTAAVLHAESAAGGMRLLWKADVTAGNSAPCVADGIIYVSGGYDTGVLSAFSTDGELLWRAPFDDARGVVYPGPRSAPVVSTRKVYVISQRGTLCCLDALNGNTVWSADLVRYGWKPDGRACATKPFAFKDAVLAIGKEGTAPVFNKATGMPVPEPPTGFVKQALDAAAAQAGKVARALRGVTVPAGSAGAIEDGILAVRADGELLVYRADASRPASGWRNRGDGNVGGACPPIRWWREKHLLWSAAPGRGGSVPVPAGRRLFLSCVPDSLVCVDAVGGAKLWSSRIADTGAPGAGTGAAVVPCPTPIVEAGRAYAVSPGGAAACFSDDGKRLWSTFVEAPTDNHGASPVLCGRVLVVPLARLNGIDAESGTVLWRTEIRAGERYGSPVSFSAEGRSMVVTPCGRIVRADDGEVLTDSLPRVDYSSPVVDRLHGIICFAGKDARTGKTGVVVYDLPGEEAQCRAPVRLWRREIPGADALSSPLVYRGFLYVLSPGGVLNVFSARDGSPVYSTTLAEENAPIPPASQARFPALWSAGGMIYACNLPAGNALSRTVILGPGPEPRQLWEYWVDTPVSSIAFAGDRQWVRAGGTVYCIGGATPKKPEMQALVRVIAPAPGAAAAEGAPVSPFQDNAMPEKWLCAGPFKPRTLDTDFLAPVGGRTNVLPVAGFAVEHEGTNIVFSPVQEKDRWKHPQFTDNMVALTVAAFGSEAGVSVLGSAWQSTAYLYTVISNDSPRQVNFMMLTPAGWGWNFPSRVSGRAWLAGKPIDEKSCLVLDRGVYPLMLQISMGELEKPGRIWMAPRLIDVSETYAEDRARYEREMAEQWPPAYVAAISMPFILNAKSESKREGE